MARVCGLPEPVQSYGRRFLGAERDLLGRGLVLIDANGERVDRAVLNGPQSAQRPRQKHVEARTEHRDRRAEALVDAALPEVDELQAAQAPAEQTRREHRGQDRGGQELQRPAAREV